MSIPSVFALVALIFLVVEQFDHKGKSVGWWGAILLAVAVLWMWLA